MPIYEYICEQDGSVVELIRPMSQADDPVPDPADKGRTFKRRQSTFRAGAASGLPISGGCCPCGKNKSACSNPSN